MRSRCARGRMRPGGPLLLVVGALAVAAGVSHGACTPVDHDHAAWTAILERWVSDGRVSYVGLSRAGQAPLGAYLDTLSGTCAADYEGWARAERIAFWLNAYNAFTVRQVLDEYPIASVRSIGWLPGAAFRRRFIPMEGLKGRLVSLDDIEHRTLRSDFHEPRIHFALVCAARSCPSLRSEAYRARDLDHQLDEQGREFLRDPAKNRFDAAARTLYLSSIFKWFRGDFEVGGRSLQAFVSRYLDVPEVADPDIRIEFLDYDWALNE